MNQNTAETLDEQLADAKIIVRAKRAYKARCTRTQATTASNPEWAIETYGHQTSVVMRSAGVIQVEYFWDGETLSYYADGPALTIERERSDLTTVESLSGETLVARALECLHALNRAAKHIPKVTTRCDYETNYAPEVYRIYSVKDRFLEALVLAQRASVETFTFPWSSWGEKHEKRWFVVDCGSGYRFHLPTVSKALEAVATPIPPHDPTQERREIPDVGLVRVAQLRCIERAIEFAGGTVPQAPTESTVRLMLPANATTADLLKAAGIGRE